MDVSFFQSKIIEWFSENKRDLPWRKNKDPYSVWISEIMLQQTQAKTVIPYYTKFLEAFPTVFDLAEASLEKVIKMWEGLGYYSRARLLHKGAKKIVEDFKGVFPSSEEDLKSIPGIGPYTLNALLSFAFHQKKVAVDANVLRVFSRFYGLEDFFSSPQLRKKVEEKAFIFLPDKAPWVVAEAFIELGALVCSKKTRCSSCPLRKGCVAFHSATQEKFPIKKIKPKIQKLHRAVFVIYSSGHLLLKKGAPDKIMSDLWEFPYIEAQEESFLDKKNILKHVELKHVEKEVFISLVEKKEWESLLPVKHSFTRFQAQLYPFKIVINETPFLKDYEWVSFDKIKEIPFSSGHKKILKNLNF